MSIDTFRAEAREWLEDNCPASMRLGAVHFEDAYEVYQTEDAHAWRDRAAARGMGIVAMKTLKGAKHRGLAEFRPEADTYAQAAFKWVLANPSVSNLVVSFYDNQHPDEYLFASGKTLEQSDVAVLSKYDQLIAGTHCFQHCGDCLGACPSGLAINDILRHRMYFEDYGDEKQAMQLYAKLDRQADACIDCAAPCLGSCPQGIQIQERLIGAHERLRWA